MRDAGEHVHVSVIEIVTLSAESDEVKNNNNKNILLLLLKV